MENNLPVQLIKTTALEESAAVAELAGLIKVKNIEGILFFCSSHYDLKKLEFELNSHYSSSYIIGCTTAGEISQKYYSNSIVALVFSSDAFSMNSILIEKIKSFDLSNAMKVASQLESNLSMSQHFDADKMFGFLLTDGLSLNEEKVTSLLYQVMGDINIIGGSAADDLEFEETNIFINNKFHTNAAVILILEVKNDFDVFRMQSFVPTQKELITTEVDFEQRVVKEFNGQPAAIAYANINGLDPNNLGTMDFAMFPLMLNIADQWYIRSISSVNDDKSLQFHCAIDNGLPLRIAIGSDMVNRLKVEVERINQEFEEIYFTLGCDCILRKIEMLDKAFTLGIEELLESINFIGFNSYGEQFNGIHFNQTLVGVVVGKKRKLN